MELVVRSVGVALCAAFAALLLRRGAPELTLPLAAAAVAVILLAAAGFLRGLRDLSDTVRVSFGVSETYTLPMLKCLSISLVTKFGAELCRDASQNAAASAVELAGTVCALSVVLPLLTAILKTVGGLL